VWAVDGLASQEIPISATAFLGAFYTLGSGTWIYSDGWTYKWLISVYACFAKQIAV